MAGNLFKYGTCKVHTNIRAKINSFTSLGDLGGSKGLEQGRELPLNAIRKFVLSFSTALFSPIFDLFSKWQVEGKGSKTSTIVYFSTANDFANFPLWQSISRRECSSSILCVLLGQEIYLCLTILVKKVEFLRVSVLTANLTLALV